MGTFLDKYFELKKQFDEVCDEVYPRIKEICEVCTRFASRDRIQSVDVEEDEPLMLDEPEVIVCVENTEVGPDTYYFPKRYLSMTIDEIKKDVKEQKEREAREKKKFEEQYQRELYEKLKKKFDGK